MATRTLDAALADFRRLDQLAAGTSWVHRLDARAKVLAVAAWVVTVVSFDRYALTTLLPLAVFPLFVTLAAGLPPGLVLRRSALVLPFALAVGLFNPLFDRAPAFELGPVTVSAGMVSLASILLRALLAAAGAVVLVATTGFAQVAAALGRLGLPRALVVQLAFLYRYLQLLGEEAGRLARARELRAGGRRLDLGGFGRLAGQLLLRTWARAERVYLAMLARGFAGRFPSAGAAHFGVREWAFLAATVACCVALRAGDLAGRLGALFAGGAP